MRRRLLLIAFHFPPIQGSSGVHRALAFSRYLPEFGWDVSVLTVNSCAYESSLADNLSLIPANVEVVRVHAFDAARHLAIHGRYLAFLARPDRWSTWIWFGVRAGLRMLYTRPADCILSTFPIASAHSIASRLSRRVGTPWIADFRDPMATDSYPHDPVVRREWEVIQRTAVSVASRVTVTTPGTAEFYHRRYPSVPPQRFAVIENGFDQSLFLNPVDSYDGQRARSERVTLVHSGILYPRERDPTAFFRALRSLTRAGVIASESIRIRLRATGFDEQLRSMLADMDLSEIVELAPPLPYVAALEEMQKADALLLFQAGVCNEQIPAKAYEYLYAARPILACVDPEGDTGKLMSRFGVPGIAALEDENMIASMLERSLPMIRSGTYPIPERGVIMSLSRRASTMRLAKLLDEVVGNRPTAEVD